MQTLSAYLGKPALPSPKYDYLAPNFVDPKLPVNTLGFKDPLQFWDFLSAVIEENPPPKDEIAGLLPMFAPLGLELGKQWDHSKVDSSVLNAMARAVQDIPKILATLPFGHPVNGWFIPPPTIGTYGTDYIAREMA